MKHLTLALLAIAITAAGLLTAARTATVASAGTPHVVLGDLTARVGGCQMTREGAVVKLSAPTSDRSLVQTSFEFQPPFVVMMRATTDSTNLRLYYNAGMVIFNWECNQQELRVHDPVTNATYSAPGKGYFEPGQMHDITWEVRHDGMRVLVDGEERFSAPGDYLDLSAPVGIGPAFGSTVCIEWFEVLNV